MSVDLESSGHLVEEEESYFVSMTDMMVGVIFIFIILLMAFALNFQVAAAERADLIKQLQEVREVRTHILETMRESLQRQGVVVEIDIARGIMRLPQEILFPVGSAELTQQGEDSVGKLAEEFMKILPCYSNSTTRALAGCEEQRDAYLEVIAVEGHTDDLPVAFGRRFQSNWELSALRAITTFTSLVDARPDLDGLENPDGQKLFSVSGYGEFRTLTAHGEDRTTESNRKSDRRIDIRFLMRDPIEGERVVNVP